MTVLLWRPKFSVGLSPPYPHWQPPCIWLPFLSCLTYKPLTLKVLSWDLPLGELKPRLQTFLISSILTSLLYSKKESSVVLEGQNPALSTKPFSQLELQMHVSRACKMFETRNKRHWSKISKEICKTKCNRHLIKCLPNVVCSQLVNPSSKRFLCSWMWVRTNTGCGYF